jgi:hypothetical protein
MAEILITSMSIKKGTIEIKEAKFVDSNGLPTKKVNLNEAFAVALKASIIDLDMDHLSDNYGV